jgi:hypothetical protein
MEDLSMKAERKKENAEEHKPAKYREEPKVRT